MDIVEFVSTAACERTTPRLGQSQSLGRTSATSFFGSSPFTSPPLFGSSPPTSPNNNWRGAAGPEQPLHQRTSEAGTQPIPIAPRVGVDRRSSMDAALLTFSRSFKRTSGFGADS